MRTIYISIAPGIRPMLPYADAEPAVANDGVSGLASAPHDALPDPSRVRVGERMRSGIVPSSSPYAGGTVGRVMASRHPGFAPGDYIFGGRHWQDFEAVDGDASLRLDPAHLPIEADLTLVGRSAFTGWVGYRRYCAAKPGETIIVSSAAGAVGMLVVQMAKADGLRVIGITSGADKCRFVTEELGADACIDRLAGDVGAALDQHAPQGADIYFDNVGGELMAPVSQRLKPFGRLIVCGMAAEYNGVEQSVVPTGSILAKRLRIQGFVVLDHEEDYEAFRDEVAALWRTGKLVYKQEVFQGLDRAPDALAACLSGKTGGGKILVQVSQDDSRRNHPSSSR
jgi:NADPH-dependent curcumin reductase